MRNRVPGWLVRTRRVLAATLVLLAFAAPLRAQPAPPEPGALAEARALFDALGMRALLQQSLAALRDPLVAQLRTATGVTEAVATKVFDEVLMPGMLESIPEMEAATAAIWARHFSVPEMRELLAFYRTPIGRKSLEMMPQLMQESMLASQAIVPRIIERVIERNREALRARGLNL